MFKIRFPQKILVLMIFKRILEVLFLPIFPGMTKKYFERNRFSLYRLGSICLGILLSIPIPSFANDHVALGGSTVYIETGLTGVTIIEFSQDGSSVVSVYDTPGYVYDLCVNDSLLFVADGSNGLLILDTSDPVNLKELGHYHTDGIAKSVAVYNDIAIVSDYAYGFQIVEFSDPSSPTALYKNDTLGDIWNVAVGNTSPILYIAAPGNGAVIWDIDNPSNPSETNAFDSDGYALDVSVKNGFIYLADGWNGLLTSKIEEPIELLEHFQTDGYGFKVVVDHNLLIFSEGTSGVRLFKIADNGSLILVDRFFEGQEITHAYIYSNHIIAADSSENFHFVRFPNEAPLITSSAPTTATVGSEYAYQASATEPDSDLLTWSISGAPSDMTLDSEDGLISWIPTEVDSVGPITLTVSDGRSGQDVETFTIEVSNPSPSPVEPSPPPTQPSPPPTQPTPPPEQPVTSNSSGGGGGCFIETLLP